MQEFKVGDRFSVEGVVTASADREGDYRALFDGHETDSYVIGAEMTHAKLIQPKPRYDWSNIPPEYDWAATDRDGAVFAYKNKPVLTFLADALSAVDALKAKNDECRAKYAKLAAMLASHYVIVPEVK